MTPGEIIAYTYSLNNIKGKMMELGCLHQAHFSGGNLMVHGNEFFFPWHRWFQFTFESLLKNSGTQRSNFLTVPYWDWRDEYNSSTITWNDNDFLGRFNIDWSLGRADLNTVGNFYGGTAAAQVQTALNLPGGSVSNFTQFSNTIESLHGEAHWKIGGIMGGGLSPFDPVFFMHHGFIDKIWQEWEENRISNQPKSAFVNTEVHAIHGLAQSCTYNFPTSTDTITPDIYQPHFNPSNIIDARNQIYIDGTDPNYLVQNEAWYAYKGKLLLDGLGGNFISTGTKVYSYVAWDKNSSTVKGSIHIGDVKRDNLNNVVNDNLGGFIISSNSNVSIHSGESIIFYPGFSSEYGAIINVSIIDKPYGFASNISLRKDNSLSLKNESPSTLQPYPNPISEGILNFGKVAESYILYNSQGVLISQGQNVDGVNVDNLENGIYLIIVDGLTSKISIE